MSEYTAVHKMADAIGFDVGQANSKTQADLLNGVGRALWRGQTALGVQMQNAYIVEDLTTEAKAWIVDLAGMIEEGSK